MPPGLERALYIRATAYQVERIDFSTSSPAWSDAPGCNSAATQCIDAGPKGSVYGYRVLASKGTNLSPWANVAVFLSEGANDGYVQKSGATKTPYPTATPSGIRAGRGATNVELRGFLSFETSALAGATVLSAKLRLYQTTNNDGYNALGSCQVDIRKGAFNGNLALEGNDFNTSSTQDDAAQVRPLSPTQTAPDWVEAELSPLYLNQVNNATTNMGHTQFRLHFDGTTSNKQVNWNAGETVSETPSTPPQLIVRYRP